MDSFLLLGLNWDFSLYTGSVLFHFDIKQGSLQMTCVYMEANCFAHVIPCINGLSLIFLWLVNVGTAFLLGFEVHVLIGHLHKHGDPSEAIRMNTFEKKMKSRRDLKKTPFLRRMRVQEETLPCVACDVIPVQAAVPCLRASSLCLFHARH